MENHSIVNRLMDERKQATASFVERTRLNWLAISNFQNRSNLNQLSVPHYMPLPSTQWNMDTMPWKMPAPSDEGMVHYFTAQLSGNCNKNPQRPQPHQKRKSDENINVPNKQFITEEKITAFLQGLHISNDYVNHQYSNNDLLSNNNNNNNNNIDENNFNNNHEDNNNNGNRNEMSATDSSCMYYSNYQTATQEMKDKLEHANRITLCDELNRLNQQTSGPINSNQTMTLPAGGPLQRHRQTGQPCMDVVLWQPSPIISILKEQQECHSKGKEHRSAPETSRTVLHNNNYNNNNLNITSMEEDIIPASTHHIQHPLYHVPAFQMEVNDALMDEDC